MADTQTAVPETADPLGSTIAKYPFLKAQKAAGEKAIEAKVGAETAKAEAEFGEKRKALEDISAKDKAKYEEVKSQMKEIPDFKPSQENAFDIGAVFSMIATMGVALGGSGKLSGLNAMNAMGGMLKGYQQGRKDLFAKEQAIFDKELQSLKAHNDALLKDLEVYQKLSATDKEAAMAKAAEIAAKNPGVIKSLIESGRADVALDIAKANTALQTKIIETAARTSLSGKGGAGGLNGRYAFNILEAAQQAGADLLNIARMPSGTVLGTFAGMTGQGGDTLLSSLSNTFARNITDEDSRQFQQLISGFDMNMARALGGGYANSGAKAAVQAYKEQVARSGDTPLAQATFLARAKQELAILNNAYKAHPGANDAEKQQMQQLTDSINQVVPFTVQDVVTASGGKGVPTIAQAAQSMVLPQAPTLEEFLQKAGAANPNMTTDQLKAKYKELYGG